MVPVIGALIAGSAIASSALAWRRVRRLCPNPSTAYLLAHDEEDPGADAAGPSEEMRETNRALAASSVALGVTVAGIFATPALVLVALPVSIYVFVPTFREAWLTVRAERRVTTPLMDATRVTVCLVMGYYGTLALDPWLRTVTRRAFLRSEEEFIRMLDVRLPATPPKAWTALHGMELQREPADLAAGDIIHVKAGERMPVDGIVRYGSIWLDEQRGGEAPVSVRKEVGAAVSIDTPIVMGDAFVEVTEAPLRRDPSALRDRVQQAMAEGTLLQEFGVSAGRTMAPRMLALAGITLPFWGPNRAAGFVTTTFGSQMGSLGRHTLQTFITLAAEQQILILDGHVLETANAVNTVIFDAALLADPVLRTQAAATIEALRRRRKPFAAMTPHGFTVYVMAERDDAFIRELVADIGADDFLVAATTPAKSDALHGLQQSGRFICYVGTGQEDPRLLEHTVMAVALPTLPGDPARHLFADGVSAILTEQDLGCLTALFDLVAQFTAKQGFNLAWPLAMDLVDIGTTVFIHFGLIYSISFSYAGLLVSALNARLPLMRYRRDRDSRQRKSALPFPHSSPR